MKHGGLWLALALLLAGCAQPAEPSAAVREIIREAPGNAGGAVTEPVNTAPQSAPVAEPLPEWWIAGGRLWRSDDGVTERAASEYGDYWFSESGGAYRVWAGWIVHSPGVESFHLWLAEYRITGSGYEKTRSIDHAEISCEAFSVSGGVITAGNQRFAVSAAGFGEVYGG
jgi:hypothetical protein